MLLSMIILSKQMDHLTLMSGGAHGHNLTFNIVLTVLIHYCDITGVLGLCIWTSYDYTLIPILISGKY